MTANAGYPDLSALLGSRPLRFGMPAGEGEEGSEDGTVEDDDTTAAPDPANDDSSPADEEDSEDENIPVRDRKIKALSDEAARHRHAAKTERDRADGYKKRVAHLTLENAFIKSSYRRISDYDAAWKLLDRSGLSVTADGEVKGLAEAIEKVIEQYPYVAEENGPADTALNTALSGLQSSGRPANRRRQPISTNNKALMQKFPALRLRR